MLYGLIIALKRSLPFETNDQSHNQIFGTKQQAHSPWDGYERTLHLFGDPQQSDLSTIQRIHG